jgi:hypothetical protein
MDALSWVRVQSALSRNHKTLALLPQKGGDRALNVFIFGLGYCAEQGNNGFIPEGALGLIHGNTKSAELLSDVGMWIPVHGGWDVNDYEEYQPSDEESKQRSERARHAAEVRWSKKNGAAS